MNNYIISIISKIINSHLLEQSEKEFLVWKIGNGDIKMSFLENLEQILNRESSFFETYLKESLDDSHINNIESSIKKLKISNAEQEELWEERKNIEKLLDEIENICNSSHY